MNERIEKVLTVRARAFSSKLQTVKVMIDADGAIRVYDDVAGYYTRCHRLTEAAMQRIRRSAKKETR